ncbi:putative hem oxygenase HugZ-like superfamily [Helianthus debilis subsp. tardiflorus]
MLVIEPATAFRIPTVRFAPDSRLLSNSRSSLIPCNKITRRNNLGKNRIRASAAEELSGPVKQAKPQRYHPSEDISDSEESDENGDAILGPAETSRTVIEVNSKAMLMFSGAVGDGVHENIFWPDLPYATDEHGNIYFQVKNDEDILQTLTSEDTLVQVIIGLDTTEMVSEMELLGQAESDFDMEEIEDENSGTDDEDNDDDDGDYDDDEDDDESGGYDNEWVSLLEEGDDDEDPGDWAKLDTMRSSHPMQFAKQMAQFVSDDPVDYMDQPPAGLAIQGVLRPTFLEENFVINKHMLDSQSKDEEADQIPESKEEDLDVINGHRYEPGPSQDGPNSEEESQKDQVSGNGTSYYKLEFVKIHLISAHGNQTFVEVEDFKRAKPDAIAHSAPKIISRLKSGGEKTTLALKSLCWRCKGLQVEEVAVIGVDSLGFDVRVCSGRQVQTLRFAFKKRASSEYSAERQLNNLLFPRVPGKQQKQKEAHQTEL